MSPSIKTSWTFGEEHEVSPGNYATLVADHSGWLLWLFETASGRYPALNKPAEGLRHALPLGVQQAFFGPTPSASIIMSRETYCIIRGKHLYSTFEYRRVGERFLTRVAENRGFDPFSYEGDRLEVIVKSMPNQRSYSKLVEERGIVDMSGVTGAIHAAMELRG